MKPIKILLVEDHKLTRKTFSFLAEKNQFQIIGEASEGAEALSLIRDQKPNVVILDLVLPKQNALELISQIKKEFSHLPIVACSSLREEHIVNQILEAGCFDYIFKPFTEQRFVQSMERAVA